MFLSTVKEIWEVVHEMSSMEKNVSRVYDLYENIFRLQQENKSVADYYRAFKLKA